jgi:hypothetical protein
MTEIPSNDMNNEQPNDQPIDQAPDLPTPPAPDVSAFSEQVARGSDGEGREPLGSQPESGAAFADPEARDQQRDNAAEASGRPAVEHTITEQQELTQEAQQPRADDDPDEVDADVDTTNEADSDNEPSTPAVDNTTNEANPDATATESHHDQASATEPQPGQPASGSEEAGSDSGTTSSETDQDSGTAITEASTTEASTESGSTSEDGTDGSEREGESGNGEDEVGDGEEAGDGSNESEGGGEYDPFVPQPEAAAPIMPKGAYTVSDRQLIAAEIERARQGYPDRTLSPSGKISDRDQYTTDADFPDGVERIEPLTIEVGTNAYPEQTGAPHYRDDPEAADATETEQDDGHVDRDE